MKSKRFYIVLGIHFFLWFYDCFVDTLSKDWSLSTVVLFNLFTTVPFYFNYFVFVPRYLKSFKVIDVVKWAFIYFVFFIAYRFFHVYFFDKIVFGIASDYEIFPFAGRAILYGIFYCSVSTGTRLLWEWLGNVQENKQLQLQKTENQLQLLKSNINFPFVMGTLEYLENKSKNDPSSVQDQIVDLSNVMRHSLYKTQNKYVDLFEEVEVVNDFLSLCQETSLYQGYVNNEVTHNPLIASGILLKLVIECASLFQRNFTVKIQSIQRSIQVVIPCSPHEFEHIKKVFSNKVNFHHDNENLQVDLD